MHEPRGIYLEYVDYQDIISKLNPPPIFINDLDNTTKQSRDDIAGLVRTNYEGDELSILPACDCGSLTGEYNRGKRCISCGTVVISITEKPIQSNVWIRAPRGVHTLIAPNFWLTLKELMTAVSFSIVDWLCSTTYQPPHDRHGFAQQLIDLGLKRGYNNFCEQFDNYIPLIFENIVKLGTKKDRAEKLAFIQEVRHNIFTPYLPIPNKIAFITEKTVVGTYVDDKIASAMDAVLTVCSIDETDFGTSQLVKENRVVKTLNQLASYYEQQFSNALGTKEGWFRKHTFGTRITYGGRTVISSLSEAHDYDEIHIPWGYAIGLLKIHLTNKLLKRGMVPTEIYRYLIEHTRKYDKLLDEIFCELIAEGVAYDVGKKLSKGENWVPPPPDPNRLIGLSNEILRNPSLSRGSSQHVRITKVKTDPEINTVSFGVNVLSAPNSLSPNYYFLIH